MTVTRRQLGLILSLYHIGYLLIASSVLWITFAVLWWLAPARDALVTLGMWVVLMGIITVGVFFYLLATGH